ncbi:MAG: hypothetical protein ACM31L_08500 [Actinomycetota bacterium]
MTITTETDPRPALREHYATLRDKSLSPADTMWALVLRAQRLGAGHEDAEMLALDVVTDAGDMTPEGAAQCLQAALSIATLVVHDERLIWAITGRQVPPSVRRRELAITAFDHARATGKSDREAFEVATRFDHQKAVGHPAIAAAIRQHMGYGRDDYWRDPSVWDMLGYERTKRWIYGFLDVAANVVFIRESTKPLTDWRGEIRNAFGVSGLEFVEPGETADGRRIFEIYALEMGADVVIPNWKNNVPPYGIAPDGKLGTWLKWVWQYVAMLNGIEARKPRATMPYDQVPPFTRAMVEVRKWPAEATIVLGSRLELSG